MQSRKSELLGVTLMRQVFGETTNLERALSGHPAFLVLIVEDNQVNQQILAHYLSNFGARYEIVANGLAAVEAVRTGRFSMVLMDIQMPIMDGVAATLAIRALPGPESMIPIYAVTAHAGAEQDASYIHCGMNGVISKPVSAAYLHRALKLSGQKASA